MSTTKQSGTPLYHKAAIDALREQNAALRDALQVIANQAGPFTRKPLPALDYATIGNIARAALASKGE